MNFRDIQERAKNTKGQSLLEFALSLPIIFLLIVNLVNFGGFFYAWVTVANAARAGADYASLGGQSVGLLGTATPSQITSLITNEVAALPNHSSISVNVCKRTGNGTPTNVLNSCTGTVGTDPDTSASPAFVLTRVEVTYTYVPFISVFSFPRMGVYLTLPPTTIYQSAETRSII